MMEKLIKKIARALDSARIAYMIIGGQAILLYGTPRLTRDIGITMGAGTGEFPKIKEICKRAALKMLPKDAESFVKNTKALSAEEAKLRIRKALAKCNKVSPQKGILEKFDKLLKLTK